MQAEDDDAGLMVAAGRGDRRAFAALFDRHQASVVRFCYRFVGTQARAEELAQDIFVKLYRGAKGWRPDAKFKTYLFRVATNHCLNELRRADVRNEAPEGRDVHDDDQPSVLHSEPSGDSPQLNLEGKELEAAVTKAMADMSQRERAAFTMCRFEGMAYRDIAQALDATEAAVKSLIHRATVTVMRHIEEWQQGLSARRSHA